MSKFIDPQNPQDVSFEPLREESAVRPEDAIRTLERVVEVLKNGQEYEERRLPVIA
jgi:transposase